MALLGSVFVPSWPIMAHLGCISGACWPILSHLGSILAHLGAILVPSWPTLAPSWTILAPSWPHLGPILAPSWAHLGPVLAPPCPILARCIIIASLTTQRDSTFLRYATQDSFHQAPSLSFLGHFLLQHLSVHLCPTSCPTPPTLCAVISSRCGRFQRLCRENPSAPVLVAGVLGRV